MIRHTAILFFMISVLISSQAYADVLELMDGSVLDGQYKGGTQGTVRFQTGGKLKVVSVKDIIALSFTGDTDSKSTAVVPAVISVPAPSSSSGHGALSVPAGTSLLVRTSEEIGTHNMSEGDRFSAKLESKLMAGTVMVAPAGATVYGRVLKSKKGGIGLRKAILELTLSQIKIDGQLRPITTSVLKGEGESGGMGRKILKAAAIGGLADGHSGAKSGAKVGAGVGILAGGKHAGIKSGSLIEFILKEPLKL